MGLENTPSFLLRGKKNQHPIPSARPDSFQRQDQREEPQRLACAGETPHLRGAGGVGSENTPFLLSFFLSLVWGGGRAGGVGDPHGTNRLFTFKVLSSSKWPKARPSGFPLVPLSKPGKRRREKTPRRPHPADRNLEPPPLLTDWFLLRALGRESPSF